jgi:hypothetical protein
MLAASATRGCTTTFGERERERERKEEGCERRKKAGKRGVAYIAVARNHVIGQALILVVM